jgi:hypothetical protein
MTSLPSWKAVARPVENRLPARIVSIATSIGPGREGRR